MKVVIPAAGLGTRFLPVTKSMPKEMLPVVGRPVIQYVVEEAVASGADDIIIVTGRGKRALEDHFDHNPELGAWNSQPALQGLESLSEKATIHFVRQRAPLGLAHAVLCAEQHVGREPFGVLLGDSIYECDPPVLSQLRMAADRWAPRGSAVALEVVPEDRVHQYGIVGGTSLGPKAIRIDRLVEKPRAEDAPSRFALTGAYWLSPRIFDCIRATPPGRRNEVELTDALQRLADQEPVVGVVIEGRRYDTGTPLLWFETNLRFGLRDPEYRAALERVLAEGPSPPPASERRTP
ncbi:MAG: UTP--glucose-1-phosphate uridylyltransferase [Thermoplasmata archaeon]|nr:UTP--glucose-1-phosphate uridylyltransferase [Thermoplasmata archaeon]